MLKRNLDCERQQEKANGNKARNDLNLWRKINVYLPKEPGTQNNFRIVINPQNLSGWYDFN